MDRENVVNCVNYGRRKDLLGKGTENTTGERVTRRNKRSENLKRNNGDIEEEGRRGTLQYKKSQSEVREIAEIDELKVDSMFG